MSETIKLIIEIPKETKQEFDKTESIALKGAYFDLDGIIGNAIKNGIPLDTNSERAEAQAYFDGEAFGWEQGRKALIDDLKAEIDEKLSHYEHFSSSNTANGLMIAKKIVEKYKGDKE